ncbi:cell division FtsA domain-containing protein [Helicovermis profundi]|uniref:Rod shape-determining protein n=1 Tax=Helicovermis profundi TaxID=3065157 RepID=A0AAU9E2M9_9FIRM|nr:rod shape-determining protein [Clostridia bacterium S502]
MNKELKKLPDEIIFSLDIGTRNVVGTLAKKIDDKYIVIDFEELEHPDRAMFDGQIHDIDKVANVVEKVKIALETRNSYKLKKVAIAAAGRALKTARVKTLRQIDYTKIIEKDLIDNIEMEAIQKAQSEVVNRENANSTKYYCVGYSVTRYYLDGSMIINPKDHKGRELEVDLIATFLPHMVVDSLYTVVDKNDLEVVNLTLEPIAAINVAIPENIRLLNLALVDVGAGTSDIAITKDGTISSYGMVSMAGDLLTEAIAKEYLLDFNTAEEVKRKLSINEKITFANIVGMDYTIISSEITEKIMPVIDNITENISNQIKEFNGKAPSAVFCIGGGCQVPQFTEKLSEKLGIPKERTVIKSTEMIKELEFKEKSFSGPEYITPIGIGYTAFKEIESNFLQVKVNDKPIRLFNSRKLNVSDALILIGFNPRDLIAKRGESYTVIVNGKEKIIIGEYGEPANIYVNGAISSLDTKLKNKDSIFVENAANGDRRYMKLSEYFVQKNIFIRGKKINLINNVKLNDEKVELSSIVKENDVVKYSLIKTVGDLAEYLDLNTNFFDMYVNGKKASIDILLKDSDEVDYKTANIEEVLEEKNTNIISDFSKEENFIDMANTDDVEYSEIAQNSKIDIDEYIKNVFDEPKINSNSDIELSKQIDSVLQDTLANNINNTKYSYWFMVNGEKVEVNNVKRKLVFVDIFEHYKFDTSKPKGMIVLKLNGKRASYTDVLKSGDVIELGWR